MIPVQTRLLTKNQAARTLSMTTRKLETHIQRGDILPVKDGHWVRIPIDEIDRFITNLRRKAARKSPIPPAIPGHQPTETML